MERVRPFRALDRVEHQRFDVLGVALRVLERHLGAVAGPVQHELFVTGGAPDGLDVLDRFGGRVVRARGPELARAAFDDFREAARRRQFGAAQRRAAQLTGRPRPALVEEQQVAASERGGDRFGDVGAQRQHRLPGTAGEGDDGAAGRGAAGEVPLDAQPDTPVQRPRAVERDGHGRTREGGVAGAGREASRHRRRGRRAGEQRERAGQGRRQQGESAPAHRTRR